MEIVVVDIVDAVGVDNGYTVGRACVGHLWPEGVVLDAEVRHAIGIDTEVAVPATAHGEVVVDDCGEARVEGIDAAGVAVEHRVSYGERAGLAAIVDSLYAAVKAVEGWSHHVLLGAGHDVGVVAV